MNFYIDGHPVSETYFWRSLEGLAGPTQIERLRTWGKLLIGGVLYEMTAVKEEEEYVSQCSRQRGMMCPCHNQ